MAKNRTCDGVLRRDFLKVGLLSGAGLNLAGFLRLADAGAVGPATATSVIQIDLSGGPSHMDTFDLKPNASSEYRGEFNPIATNVPGISISEHLPRLAKCADKYAILRGVSHSLAAHEFGTKYMNTGNRPLPSIDFPGIGCVVTKERPGPVDLPQFVAVPNARQAPGFLGVAYAPFNTTSFPSFGKPYSVRGVTLGNGIKIESVERREKLLNDLDIAFSGYEKSIDIVHGVDKFSQQAYDIISGKRSREAFDISKEPLPVAERFGKDNFGQSCLLACRLVEAGVRFVNVVYGGWDTHQKNFESLKTQRLPVLDQGLAGLFTTLAERGMLKNTLVYVTGEFGRTPKINPNAGRDHWPRAMFVLLAGGGVKGGVCLGASDENGMGPKEKGITPDDIVATIYRTLGIDSHKEYHTNSGRPIMIVRDGKPIQELLS